MRVTLKGMLIDFIAVCANANIPIFSNVLGKETICNLVHPSKTSQPISLQFLGSMIDINLESKSLSELSERVHEKLYSLNFLHRYQLNPSKTDFLVYLSCHSKL